MTVRSDFDQVTDLLDHLEHTVDRYLQTIEEQSGGDALQQLKIIEDALGKFRAKNTPVPAAMEKIHADLLSKAGDALAAADSLAAIRERLGEMMARLNGVVATKRAPRQSTSRAGGLRVPQFKVAIVEALEHLGGSATRSQVFDLLHDRLQYDFEDVDREIVPGDLPRWKQRTAQARRELVREGVLEDVQGVWTLHRG